MESLQRAEGLQEEPQPSVDGKGDEERRAEGTEGTADNQQQLGEPLAVDGLTNDEGASLSGRQGEYSAGRAEEEEEEEQLEAAEDEADRQDEPQRPDDGVTEADTDQQLTANSHTETDNADEDMSTEEQPAALMLPRVDFEASSGLTTARSEATSVGAEHIERALSSAPRVSFAPGTPDAGTNVAAGGRPASAALSSASSGPEVVVPVDDIPSETTLEQLRAEYAPRLSVAPEAVRLYVGIHLLEGGGPLSEHLPRYFQPAAPASPLAIRVRAVSSDPEAAEGGKSGSRPSTASRSRPASSVQRRPISSASSSASRHALSRGAGEESAATGLPTEGEGDLDARPATAEPSVPVPTEPEPREPQQVPQPQPAVEYEMTVKVPGSEGAADAEVLVKVVREGSASRVPFRGGYRNSLTGQEYHNRDVQTASLTASSSGIQKFHRQSQTEETRTRSQQMTHDSGTQMEKKDLLLDTSRDRVLEAKPYQTADEFEQLKTANTIGIQCFLRSVEALRLVRRLAVAKEAQEREEEEQRRAEQDRVEQDFKSNLQRRANPQTKKDFALLEREVEEWRLAETRRIQGANLSPEERSREMRDLLHKEVKLMQSLDRMKIAAAVRNRDVRTKKTLQMMAAPKEWDARSSGNPVQVETPLTVRAKELAELYHGLGLKSLSRDERLDVLFNVQWVVKDFDCQLTRDMLQLIEREIDLLNRGRRDSSLEGLRKRLLTMFLTFSRTSQFNPEAAKFDARYRAIVSRSETRQQ